MHSSALLFLAATAYGQVVSNQGSNYAVSVNIPQDTASGNGQTIFMQISAPSGTQWVGIGQGNEMAGANMMLVYASSANNITVSPRLGTGEVQPDFNSEAQISVLEGSGIDSNGALIANIRCDSCLKWNGGSMSPSDSNSNWIWAYKTGSAIDSTSESANLQQHDNMGTFNLNLQSGTGGTSQNPFVAASPSGSGSGSGSTPQPTSTGVSSPVGTSAPISHSSPNNTNTVRIAHAVIMSAIFLILFPLAALTLYLPYTQRVRFVHAPLQLLSLILLIIGLALGVVLGQRVDKLDEYHQVIGYFVVALLVLFQPALGIYQHMYYRKTGGRSPMGIVHRWLGRSVIILGVINGGLGFMQAGPVGLSDDAPSYAVVTYSIIAGVIFIIYISVVLASIFKSTSRPGRSTEKDFAHRGYEMQPSPNRQAYGQGAYADQGRVGHRYR